MLLSRDVLVLRAPSHFLPQYFHDILSPLSLIERPPTSWRYISSQVQLPGPP
jgi:hypothetical protein